MEGFEELKKMLSDHMKESGDGISDIKQSIARIEVHGEYTSKAIEGQGKDISELKTAHNKQKGAMWVLSLIGLGGLEELIRNWAK